MRGTKLKGKATGVTQICKPRIEECLKQILGYTINEILLMKDFNNLKYERTNKIDSTTLSNS